MFLETIRMARGKVLEVIARKKNVESAKESIFRWFGLVLNDSSISNLANIRGKEVK